MELLHITTITDGVITYMGSCLIKHDAEVSNKQCSLANVHMEIAVKQCMYQAEIKFCPLIKDNSCYELNKSVTITQK